jgi:SAGA-associated factor 73
MSLQSKYKYHRMRDMLRNALSGANGRDLFATPATGLQSAGMPSAGLFSASALPEGMGMGMEGFDMGGMASRRGSMAPTRQMVPGGGGSRKPSISGTGAL